MKSTLSQVREIVDNSYGTVQSGPFKKLTCIIWPTGAGKSNLMNAISLVLGVQAGMLFSLASKTCWTLLSLAPPQGSPALD